MPNLVDLVENDYKLIEAAKWTFDTLFVPGRHEVAAALRTASEEMFCGIHGDIEKPQKLRIRGLLPLR